MRTFMVLLATLALSSAQPVDEPESFNEVNPDGTFKHGLTVEDEGGHYHYAKKTPDDVVRGRYGARNPETGNIDETVYTAGIRGFRARGPQIHRKTDLSQVPRGPIGTADDPNADPYDDPSYSFKYEALDSERREDADANGRVTGLYSYIDDVGESHTVRYAAGAETGFEVLNSVPDSPISVNYNAPLYKAPIDARGRMSVQRGRDGQYRFLVSSPDQRRSETSGPDGVVRGSYSYLDETGVQRTVQYIAGAGIGYRVVQTSTSIGGHLAARPAIPELGYRDEPNDFDDGYPQGLSPSGGRPTSISPTSFPNRRGDGDRRGTQGTRAPGGSGYDRDRFTPTYDPNRRGGRPSTTSRPGVTGTSTRYPRPGGGDSGGTYPTRGSGSGGFGSTSRPPTSRVPPTSGFGSTTRPYPTVSTGKPRPGDRDGFGSNSLDGAGPNRGRPTFGSKPTRPTSGGFDNRRPVDRDDDFDGGFGDREPPTRDRDDKYTPDRRRPTTGGRGPARGGGTVRPTGSTSPGYGGGTSRPTGSSGPGSGYGVPGGEDFGPTEGPYSSDRDRGSPNRNGQRPTVIDRTKGRIDSTLIRNLGNRYFTIPPGSLVRAHVQNIDLIPIEGGAPSPSDALRYDVLAEECCIRAKPH